MTTGKQERDHATTALVVQARVANIVRVSGSALNTADGDAQAALREILQDAERIQEALIGEAYAATGLESAA